MKFSKLFQVSISCGQYQLFHLYKHNGIAHITNTLIHTFHIGRGGCGGGAKNCEAVQSVSLHFCFSCFRVHGFYEIRLG